MASTALSTTALEQILQLSQLTLVRQLGFMVVFAASIALGASVVLWSQDEDYMALFPEATTQDNAEVVTALQQNNFSYKLDPTSGMVTVPSAQAQQIRLQLATMGLPRSSTSSGFDSLNETSAIGTSNFVEQARYNRALEQELVTTVKLIRGVRDARVHLSIPKQTTFLRTGNKPSASVMLDVIGSQSISDIQIAGIAHLVASSVAGLESENVSIVDHKGSLLSKRQGSELGGSSEQMQYTRSLEEEYTQRIMAILTPIVGEGKVRAQVTADLDFTVVETTAENYNPNNVVLRSEQSQIELRDMAGSQLPGELSPTPPTDAAGEVVAPEIPILGALTPEPVPNQIQASNQSRNNTTRNYEIDRSVSHTRTVPGGIKRLSVAVVVELHSAESLLVNAEDPAAAATTVNPTLEAEKLARLSQLVRDTVGFSESRGDSVNVISEVFSTPATFLEPEPVPVWQQSWVPSAAKQLAASLVVLMLIFSVLRPALRSVVSTVAVPEAPQLAHQHQVDLGGMLDEEPKKAAGGRTVYDENLQLAQTIVTTEPARAARMIKDWVAGE